VQNVRLSEVEASIKSTFKFSNSLAHFDFAAHDIDWIVTLSGVEMGQCRLSAFDFVQADKSFAQADKINVIL